MIVYVDAVAVLNFAVNLLLLYGSARLGAAAIRKGRLLSAAAIGALYAVAVYLPGLAFLEAFPFKLLCAGAMLATAFGLRRQIVRLGGVFFALSLVLCGAVYAVQLFRGRGPGQSSFGLFFPVSFFTLLLTALAVALACRLLLPRLTHASDSLLPLTVHLNGRSVQLNALRDSGNTLADPISGQAVLTVYWKAACGLLPGELSLSRADFAEPAVLALKLKALHPRLIPYRAVGVSRGLLLALPCRITLKEKTQNGLVAFCPTVLSDGGAYDALIGGNVNV